MSLHIFTSVRALLNLDGKMFFEALTSRATLSISQIISVFLQDGCQSLHFGRAALLQQEVGCVCVCVCVCVHTNLQLHSCWFFFTKDDLVKNTFFCFCHCHVFKHITIPKNSFNAIKSIYCRIPSFYIYSPMFFISMQSCPLSSKFSFRTYHRRKNPRAPLQPIPVSPPTPDRH